MALQTSGQITLSQIAAEFGDTAPHALSEFYGSDSGVPASGQIRFNDMYGAQNIRYYYDAGDEYSSVTGGWNHVRTGTSNSSHGLTKNASYMDFFCLMNSYTSIVITGNARTNSSITIPSSHTALKANVQVVEMNASSGFGLKSNANAGSFSPSTSWGGAGSKTLTRSVSGGQTGHIHFWFYGGQHHRGRIYIQRVWSE